MHRYLNFHDTLGRSWQLNIQKAAVIIGQKVWWLVVKKHNTFLILHTYLNFFKENEQLYLPNYHLHKDKMLFSSSGEINNFMAGT